MKRASLEAASKLVAGEKSPVFKCSASVCLEECEFLIVFEVKHTTRRVGIPSVVLGRDVYVEEGFREGRGLVWVLVARRGTYNVSALDVHGRRCVVVRRRPPLIARSFRGGGGGTGYRNQLVFLHKES